MSGLEFVVVAVAVLAGALVKAVTGVGLPIIAIPAMSLFIPVEEAVVIIAVPNAIMNFALLRNVAHAAGETRDLVAFNVAGVVGAVIGTFVLVSVSEKPLLVVLAVVVLGYVVSQGRRKGVEVGPATSRRWAPPVGLGAGVMQGAVGISGPIVASWMHAYRLPRDAYVFSVTVSFLLSGTTQIVVLAASGRLWGEPLVLGLAATIPILATVPLGARIRDRLAGPVFDRIVLVMLSTSAVALLARVIW